MASGSIGGCKRHGQIWRAAAMQSGLMRKQFELPLAPSSYDLFLAIREDITSGTSIFPRLILRHDHAVMKGNAKISRQPPEVLLKSFTTEKFIDDNLPIDCVVAQPG